MSLSVPPPSLKIKRRRDEEPIEALYIEDAAKEGSSDNPRKTKQRRLLDGCRVDYVFKLQPAGRPGAVPPAAKQASRSKLTSGSRLRESTSSVRSSSPHLRQVPPLVRVSKASEETGQTRLGETEPASSVEPGSVSTSSASESEGVSSSAKAESAEAATAVDTHNAPATGPGRPKYAVRASELRKKASSSSLSAREPLRPRRFQLSQQSLQTSSSSRPSSRIGKRSRVAVFVERELVRKIRSRPDLVGLGSASVPPPAQQPSAEEVVSTAPKRELDRPIKDWDLESPAVLAELEAWTKEEVQADLQLEEAQQKLAYKPKRPPTRIKDREAAAAATVAAVPAVESSMVSDSARVVEDEDTNDGEFVYDTYIRVPVATIPKTLADPLKSYGILALSSLEMEQWEALYAEGEEDSDEARRREGGMDDESDENAEDWGGNDYPDEEDEEEGEGEQEGGETDDELIEGFDSLGFGPSSSASYSYSASRQRGRGNTTADDEEWDLDAFDEEDVGAWSAIDKDLDHDDGDDADLDEAEIGMLPWKKHRLG